MPNVRTALLEYVVDIELAKTSFKPNIRVSADASNTTDIDVDNTSILPIDNKPDISLVINGLS